MIEIDESNDMLKLCLSVLPTTRSINYFSVYRFNT